MYTYEPASGHGLEHDPFIAIIAPRPIGWISTRDKSGRRNLAPYSFFNAFNYRPPIIGFATIGWKDTARNAQETGVFVWNLATRGLAQQMNITSAPYPPEVDEFSAAGLTPTPGRLVGADRIEESPVSFECRLSQIVQLRAADNQVLGAWVVFGEVVAVHIDESLIRGGAYDTLAADPIMRVGGTGDYFGLSPEGAFTMRRPIL